MININDAIEFIKEMIIDIKGNTDNVFVENLKPLGEENPNTLNWINPKIKTKQSIAENTKSKVIICDPSIQYSQKLKEQNKILIHVKNPKLAVSLVTNHFFVKKVNPYIHETASIHPKAEIHETAYIGANCSIGNCKIGKNTVIHANTSIYDDVQIGNNCLIQAGVVIGTDGLGCERKEDGTLIKFPHFGGVIIEDNVEIGANSQIAKGALSDTIIGEGTKINGLCFIAHNCIIGKSVWITGNSMLAGTVKVGNNVNIFSGAIVREQRTLGEGATIGMGAVVTKNIPEGETWIGNPAKKI